jgi:UDP-N-acetylmuramate dehydrogenase
MSGGKSAVVPPDPMPNSEVKRRSADGSVGITHARVGSRQTFNF